MTDESTILVVDDDPQVLKLFESYLSKSYSVITAANGEQALDAIDDTIDVVILDRRMPELSGDEVLEAIRERNYDCPVIMVTAVDPGADIITMPFNDYLLKPVSIDELETTVKRALALSRRDIQMQEYFALQAKRDAIENNLQEHELEQADAYSSLLDQIDSLQDRIEPPIQQFEEEFAEKLTQSAE